jgi:hypothetical protein
MEIFYNRLGERALGVEVIDPGYTFQTKERICGKVAKY